MSEIKITYDYNGTIIVVAGNHEFHQQLQNDHVFANEYFKNITNHQDQENEDVHEERNEEQVDEVVNEDASGTWTIAATKHLLHEYKKRINLFRNPKVKKINLWREIEEELNKENHKFNNCTIQCKFRNMKVHYSKIKQNNSKRTTGTGRLPWMWMEEMDEIFHNDKSINFSSEGVISSIDEINTTP